MPGFDVKQIKRNDQVILGAGILFLLLSFFAPFYGVSIHAGGFGGSASWTAWHSYGFLAVLLIIIAVGDRGCARVRERVAASAADWPQPVGRRALGARDSPAAPARLHLQDGSGLGYSYGQKWGAWVLYILAIAVVVAAVMNLMASGEKVAWDPTAMNKGGAAAGGAVPPAAPYPPQDAAPTYPPAADYPPASGSSDTPSV